MVGGLVAGCGSTNSSGASGTPTGTSATGTSATGTSATGTGSTSGTTGATTTVARGSGPVDVLSAGSLQTLMTKTVDPAFDKATGYTASDFSAGSSDLAADIRAKTQVADVFVSASPAVNATLEGAANGDWESWYAEFASSPVVLGYYPKSRFAKDLKTEPWYKVITMSGFRLGRTDPAEDPGGVLAVDALKKAATEYHDPALTALTTSTSDEYQETAIQGDVESGQLDAAFMYLADANSDNLPHVDLTGTDEAGGYTITILTKSPHLAAAEAFVEYLLGPAGQAAMKADQFKIVSPPTVSGSGAPAALDSVLHP